MGDSLYDSGGTSETRTDRQPTVVNEVVENYLRIATGWQRWLSRGYERPMRIDNDGLALEDGNDFA